MEVRSFVKKYQLILILSFIAVVMFFVRSMYGYKGEDTEVNQVKNNSPQVKITPIPTTTTAFKAEEAQDINPEFPLYSLLPYTTDNFVIEDYFAPFVLIVKPLTTNKNQIEIEIKQWIKENGPDVDSHRIIWTDEY